MRRPRVRPWKPKPTVRLATAEDAGAIHLLMRAAFAAYEPALGYAPSPMARDFRPMIKANFVLTLEAWDGALYGAAATRPRPDYLYVDAVAVAPTRQRKGDGAQLMAAVEMLAGSLCYERVRLHTSPLLEGPMRFYETLGYRLIGRVGAGADARVAYEKVVPSALETLLMVGDGDRP